MVLYLTMPLSLRNTSRTLTVFSQENLKPKFLNFIPILIAILK